LIKQFESGFRDQNAQVSQIIAGGSGNNRVVQPQEKIVSVTAPGRLPAIQA
jgi:hypothetical protein